MNDYKTADLVEHVLLSATTITPEMMELADRMDRLLDAAFEVQQYLLHAQSAQDRDDARRDFVEYVFDNYLHG